MHKTTPKENDYLKNRSNGLVIIPDVQAQGANKNSLVFTTLLEQGIIKKTISGKYYRNEHLEKDGRKRRRDILIISGIAIASAIVLGLLVLDYISGDAILLISGW